MADLAVKPLLISFILLLCFSSAFAALAGDAQILIRVKGELSDPDGMLDDWVPNSHRSPCNWTGITCDPDETSVVAINISGSNVAGGFPSGFCRIRTLQNLSISSSCINGTLKTEAVSTCSNLRVLDLRENLLVGSLPDFSPGFASLQVLILENNNFTGDIPASFGRLPSLRVLRLTQNFLTGPVPALLGNLTELTHLALAYMNMKPGELPPEIGNLAKLQTLFMPNCNRMGRIPESIGNLTSLTNLDLSQNNLTGPLPESIGRLRRARKIFLFSNQLSGELPESIGNSAALTDLDLSENGFTGILPSKIAELPLFALQLNDNFLRGQVPDALAANPNLHTLKLFNNSFSGSLPENFGRYSDLFEFDVSTNNFTGELPKYLCSRKNLSRLIAFGNRLTGALPDSLIQCDSLGYVRIEHNRFNGIVPDGFWGLPLLTMLQIQGNRFNGTVSPSISAASGLTSMMIYDNAFSGVLPPAICKLPELAKLDVSANQFSGDLPSCMTELKKLEELRMQGNRFSGQIPSSVSSWNKLTELTLSGNRLTGSIPPGLGDLPVLTYLDLSGNLLTGEIPAELTKLRLNEFNVSNNKLYGKVPSGFNNDAYMSGLLGNPNLCGSNLKPVPPCTKPKSPTPVLIAVLCICVVLLVVTVAWYLKFRSKVLGGKNKRLLSRVTTFQRVGFNEKEVTAALTNENLIATGGSGHVYKVKLKTGLTVAVKKLWGGLRKPETESVFRSEVETLGRIRHGNIVKLMFCCSGEDSMILGFEFMENGSLGDCLHGEKVGALEDWAKRFDIAVGAAHGLAYLHHDCVPAIVHRDVKSNNILLDEEWTPRVADFGLAKTLQSDVAASIGDMSRIAGSHGYIAPEYGYTLKVSEKSDVYSFGVVLLELITGKRPNDISFGENKDIVKWATEAVMSSPEGEEGDGADINGRCGLDLRQIVDPRMDQSTCDYEEIEKVLDVALLCTSAFPINRPSMRKVVDMLTKDQKTFRSFKSMDHC